MKIQPARTTDIPFITELTIENWKQTYASLISGDFLDHLSAEAMTNEWRQYTAEKNHLLFVARDDQTFLGFTAGRPDEEIPDCFYLESLHVTASARGRGIGTKLLKTLAAEAAQCGYRKMSICIIKGNDSARNLYRKSGAEHYKDFQDDFHGTTTDSEKLIWNEIPLPHASDRRRPG
ncbi:MAG: GNAT family N-acetyltransferase [Lachnospiraceae bacterium]|nr:GNAT family N-acetyltransferase [Lachnospiraceae bacterium]